MGVDKFLNECEIIASDIFKNIDEVSLFNQEKVLNAFQNNKIALRHFSQTSGYGYDDSGRDALNAVYAEVFGCESAIVSPLIASGTHAISTVLFGLLRPDDTMLSISGMPYDTLESVILGDGIGSLKDYRVNFTKIDLLNGEFDFNEIEKVLQKVKPKIVFIQRSRGYSARKPHSIEDIKTAINRVKKISPKSLVVVDNCYGEFVDKLEPTEVGADIIVGSLIKNPGGGLAPTGGYIAGRKSAVELISYRLTAPGIGCEVGSYEHGYRNFYQGFFLAPHVTAQAMKGSVLFGVAFEKLGYDVLPKACEPCGDIIRSIIFKTEQELITFCQTIQKCSPIDSFAIPYPWDMPGYSNQVIMAAGTFVQGASIELSADAPIKSPYIAYLQGGLTYEHVKIALKQCLLELGLIK